MRQLSLKQMDIVQSLATPPLTDNEDLEDGELVCDQKSAAIGIVTIDAKTRSLDLSENVNTLPASQNASPGNGPFKPRSRSSSPIPSGPPKSPLIKQISPATLIPANQPNSPEIPLEVSSTPAPSATEVAICKVSSGASSRTGVPHPRLSGFVGKLSLREAKRMARLKPLKRPGGSSASLASAMKKVGPLASQSAGSAASSEFLSLASDDKSVKAKHLGRLVGFTFRDSSSQGHLCLRTQVRSLFLNEIP